METKHQAFEEMLASARKRLENRRPEELAQRSGSIYEHENKIICLTSLGQSISIRLPSYEFEQPIREWHQLVILHYLDLADQTPVSEEQITFGNLKDGLIRGIKFDHTMDRELTVFLKNKSEDQILRIIKACGGRIISSNADICAQFEFLPFYPLWLKIWLSDEEFDASGKVLLSKSADHYLTIEDAVTVGDVFLERLKSVPCL